MGFGAAPSRATGSSRLGGAAPAAGERSEVRGHRQQIGKSAALTRGNARLKVGEVKEKDADTITADVVTKDNSLVQRFIIDRHTGVYREDNS